MFFIGMICKGVFIFLFIDFGKFVCLFFIK